MGLVVNINNNIHFHFRLFPGETNLKIFKKIQETLFWDHLGPFCLKLGKNDFSGKKWSVSI